MENTQRLAILLQDVVDTMTRGGTFIEMDNCDADSGLPLVESHLRQALTLAKYDPDMVITLTSAEWLTQLSRRPRRHSERTQSREK